MPYRYARPVQFGEFVGRVRRHRRSDLLQAVASVTAEQLARGIHPPKERLVLPWGLAAAARESIFAGNDNRPPWISLRDIQEICGAFNALEDPFVTDQPTIESLHSFFVRISYEQFPYQISRFEEVSRVYVVPLA